MNATSEQAQDGTETPVTTEIDLTVALNGGPADGTTRRVPRIAGRLPRYLGIEGGNYTLDHSTMPGESPRYLWWPAGASAPVGRQTAGDAETA